MKISPSILKLMFISTPIDMAVTSELNENLVKENTYNSIDATNGVHRELNQ